LWFENEKEKCFFLFWFYKSLCLFIFETFKKSYSRNKFKWILVPVLFAGFLKENETKGPAEIPSKRIFIFKDITRIGLKQNISIKGTPFNPLLPLRVISSIKNEEMKWKVTLKLFDACWRDGIDISDEKNIDQLLDESISDLKIK